LSRESVAFRRNVGPLWIVDHAWSSEQRALVQFYQNYLLTEYLLDIKCLPSRSKPYWIHPIKRKRRSTKMHSVLWPGLTRQKSDQITAIQPR